MPTNDLQVAMMAIQRIIKAMNPQEKKYVRFLNTAMQHLLNYQQSIKKNEAPKEQY